MKKSINFFSIFLIGLFTLITINNGVFAEDKVDGPKFEYKAEDNTLYLDTMYIDEIEEVKLDIEFENKGNEPLILTSVRACCGTRVNHYTEEPIAPGDTGIIKVSFRVAPRPHGISRSVTTMSNDSDRRKILRIRGVVAKK